VTKHTWKWAALAIGSTGAVIAIWLSSELSKCEYRESAPTYSPDKTFFTQMQFTICHDHAKSRVRLVIGAAGKPDRMALLDLGPSIGTVDLSWHEGPELHVQVPESAITKRYGPYDGLPRVVVTNPQGGQ
jgi:hypothetical protein